jgi:hypothetical protein
VLLVGMKIDLKSSIWRVRIIARSRIQTEILLPARLQDLVLKSCSKETTRKAGGFD